MTVLSPCGTLVTNAINAPRSQIQASSILKHNMTR